MRRRIILIASLAGLILIIAVILVFGRRTTKVATTLPLIQSQKRELTGQILKTKKIQLVSREPAFDYWVSEDAEKIFYINTDGKILQIGEKEELILNGQEIDSLASILPSPDKTKVIVSFGRNIHPQYSIFDLKEKSWLALPLNITALSWSEKGKIAALYQTENGQNLIILDEGGEIEKTLIKNLALEDVILDWAETDDLFFKNKSSAFVLGEIWKLNLNNLEWSSLIAPREEAKGFTWEWHRGAGIGFMFSENGVTLTDIDTKPFFNLSAMTFPDKCAAYLKNIYCFVPRKIEDNLILPDDYFQKNIYFEDDLYELSLETEGSRLLFASDESFTVDGVNPQLMNGKIYFINRYDNRIYSLEL